MDIIKTISKMVITLTLLNNINLPVLYKESGTCKSNFYFSENYNTLQEIFMISI